VGTSLLGGNVGRTGVLMMDFPGAGLIDTIIAHNFALGPLQVQAEAATTWRSPATPTAHTVHGTERLRAWCAGFSWHAGVVIPDERSHSDRHVSAAP
jgi:hypothetical protein